jgi:DNA-binding FadR family transcriptional regulator
MTTKKVERHRAKRAKELEGKAWQHLSEALHAEERGDEYDMRFHLSLAAKYENEARAFGGTGTRR